MRRRLAYLVKDRPEATQWITRIRVRDGRILDLQVDWDYKRDLKGRVVGFIAVVTDRRMRPSKRPMRSWKGACWPARPS